MARERYLINAGESAETYGKEPVKPKTPKEKWENFWFYHKWHVIIGCLAAAVGAYLIFQTVSRVEPDYTIGLICSKTYPDDAVGKLEKQMEKYGTDRNKDGKVTVTIVQYNISSSSSASPMADPNAAMAASIKLDADIETFSSALFLTDDANFLANQKQLQMFAYLDGTTPAEGAADYDRMRVSYKSCKAFGSDVFSENYTDMSGNSYDMSTLFGNLSLSPRILQNTKYENDSNKKSYYNDCLQLMNALISGKPIVQNMEVESK